jgi:formylglycine-generating enzyme
MLLGGSLLACMNLDRYHAQSGSTVGDGGAGDVGGSAGGVRNNASVGGGPTYAGSPGTGTEFLPLSPSCPPTAAALCQGQSCCTAIAMPGGTYPMGRSEVSSATDYYPPAYKDEIPEHYTTVAAFALDKYEVTVGRFRAFIDDYDAWHATAGNPKVNTGMHPHAGFTGWAQSWTAATSDLPSDAAALKASLQCDATKSTDNADAEAETYPINCVSWYTAFAFCIWDGGRLPTEAEREYAAAGGCENRMYPWGSQEPDNGRANYWGSENHPMLAVGSKDPSGSGIFGHSDLAGSVSEWVFDWYDAEYYGKSGKPVDCDNCANAGVPIRSVLTHRVTRGGNWDSGVASLRVAIRGIDVPEKLSPNIGFRCARAVE